MKRSGSLKVKNSSELPCVLSYSSKNTKRCDVRKEKNKKDDFIMVNSCEHWEKIGIEYKP